MGFRKDKQGVGTRGAFDVGDRSRFDDVDALAPQQREQRTGEERDRQLRFRKIEKRRLAAFSRS